MENKIKSRKTYSENFKRKVLSEVLLGLSLSSVSRKYGIRGSSTVSRWCADYGIKVMEVEYVDLPLDELTYSTKSESMSDVKSTKSENGVTKSIEDKIKLLEYELALYKKLVEIAKRDYNLDLVKKLNTKQSEK